MSALRMEKELMTGFIERRDLGLILRWRESAERSRSPFEERVILPLENPFNGFPSMPSTESSAPKYSSAAYRAARTSRSPAKSAPATAEKHEKTRTAMRGTVFRMLGFMVQCLLSVPLAENLAYI